MKYCLFLFFLFFLGCNTLNHISSNNRKKFVYAVTEPIDQTGFIIRLKIFDSARGYKYIWNRTSTLYYLLNLESGIDSTTFRKMIREIILKDSSFNTSLLGRYRYRDTLAIKPDINKIKEIENIVKNAPNFIDTFFYERKGLKDKWRHNYVEVAWVLWEKNIGLRTLSEMLGYYDNHFVNDSAINILKKEDMEWAERKKNMNIDSLIDVFKKRDLEILNRAKRKTTDE